MRSFLINLSLTIAGLLFAAVIAEIVLRTFNIAPVSGIATVSEYYFERVPGLFIPNQELIDRRKSSLPHQVHINSLGYRGGDFPIQKPDGEFRIVMVGDSFTYGDFVDDNETLPARLETILRDFCGNVRVINAGVGGTTIVTHSKMADRSLQLDPDLVILTFSENDVRNLASPMWYALADNRRKKSSFPFSIIYPVARHTALWNYSLKVKARLSARLREGHTPGMHGSHASSSGSSDHLSNYANMLSALHKDLNSHNVSFAFAAYPSRQSVNHEEKRELINWVAQSTDEMHIDFVNLLESLVDSGVPVNDLYLYPIDGHPSPAGYTVSAEYLSSELIRMGRIEKTCSRHY